MYIYIYHCIGNICFVCLELFGNVINTYGNKCDKVSATACVYWVCMYVCPCNMSVYTYTYTYYVGNVIVLLGYKFAPKPSLSCAWALHCKFSREFPSNMSGFCILYRFMNDSYIYQLALEWNKKRLCKTIP